jgi:hypothetical protein
LNENRWRFGSARRLCKGEGGSRSWETAPSDCAIDQLTERSHHPLEPGDGIPAAMRIDSTTRADASPPSRAPPPPADALGHRRDSACLGGRHEFFERVMVRLERVHGIPRACERLTELSRRPCGNDATAIEHDHAIAQLECLFGAMRSDEHRTSPPSTQLLPEERTERTRGSGVEAPRRLVEQEDARAAEQSAGDEEPLHHPGGKLPHHFASRFRQADDIERLVDTSRDVVHRRATAPRSSRFRAPTVIIQAPSFASTGVMIWRTLGAAVMTSYP